MAPEAKYIYQTRIGTGEAALSSIPEDLHDSCSCDGIILFGGFTFPKVQAQLFQGCDGFFLNVQFGGLPQYCFLNIALGG